MFWITVGWLALVGTGLHLLNDVPAVSGDMEEAAAQLPGRFHSAAIACLWAAAAVWPLYWLELACHRWAGGRRSSRDWQAALFPPLRIGARDHVTGRMLWLPTLGWVRATDDLEARLERQLGVPMIIVALLVLPVIAIELIWAERIAHDWRLGLATQLAGAAIWLAFAVEFLVQVSIVRDRWTYVRRHWLDLAIICLPLLAFLRVLRVGRLGRLLRLNQLSKVSRTARAYRMRGLAMRVWRALLLLEAVDRWMHRDDAQRLAKLQTQLAAAEKEVQRLRDQISRLETKAATTGGTTREVAAASTPGPADELKA
jgi:voltage-gated potassium channel